ncbi:hypothetical protein ACFE04_015645 [Oxalis oulophora]
MNNLQCSPCKVSVLSALEHLTAPTMQFAFVGVAADFQLRLPLPVHKSGKEGSSSSRPLHISNSNRIEKSRVLRAESDGTVAVCQEAHAREDHHKEKRKRVDPSNSTCHEEGHSPRKIAQENGLLKNGPLDSQPKNSCKKEEPAISK